MIEMSKSYKTRNGRKVRILCTDGDKHPVVGLVEGYPNPSVWTKEGRYRFYPDAPEDPNDLVEYTPPAVRYYNIYPNGIVGKSCHSRSQADAVARPARVSCRRIEIDVTPGVFDD